MDKNLLWMWLSLKLGAASPVFYDIYNKLSDIESIYNADFDTYTEAGIGERYAELLSDKDTRYASEVVSYCSRYNVQILHFGDESYPRSLRSLKNPPILLYVWGKMPDLNRNLCIAVVGTRRMSEYGMRHAYKISYEMASAGAVIVSGMALGIDGIASCGAITAGGKTIAVLGCGIDVVYPKEHATLEKIIAHNGAIITEYPPSTKPAGMNFPIRNRIISGLAQGTLVVDADIGSGAMITAKEAILQGRDIYAVPGNIDGRNTSGTNSLIRDGAQAVLCGRDVIQNYTYIYRDTLNTSALSKAEKRSDIDLRAVRDMEVSVRYYSEKKENDTLKNEISQMEERGKAEKKKQKEASRAARAEAPRENEKPTAEPKEEARVSDMSQKIIEALNEKQRAVFDEIPLDKPITVDGLMKLGFTMGEIMSSLTILEIKGLISSLPGALYIRK